MRCSSGSCSWTCSRPVWPNAGSIATDSGRDLRMPGRACDRGMPDPGWVSVSGDIGFQNVAAQGPGLLLVRLISTGATNSRTPRGNLAEPTPVRRTRAPVPATCSPVKDSAGSGSLADRFVSSGQRPTSLLRQIAAASPSVDAAVSILPATGSSAPGIVRVIHRQVCLVEPVREFAE